MTNRITLAPALQISCIVHGHWRLKDWDISAQQLLQLTEQAIDLGITTFDHADIYGNYSCEQLFGDALSIKKELRKSIEIITKCGIKLNTEKNPGQKIKLYDYSFKHIVSSAEKSLTNFRTDYIDILLLHRPSPFFNPEEVAKAFAHLKQSGKVLFFGVSNFSARQQTMLAAYSDVPLVTNQVEISPYCLEHFDNGNMDYFLEKKMHPMAWSPLAGGQILQPHDEKGQRIFAVLKEIANELNTELVDKIIYCWLLKHPAGIIPVAGSSRIERLQYAADALSLQMSTEQWFRIYNASQGRDLP